MPENSENNFILKWECDNIFFEDNLLINDYPSASDYYLEWYVCSILEKYRNENYESISNDDKISLLYASFLQERIKEQKYYYEFLTDLINIENDNKRIEKTVCEMLCDSSIYNDINILNELFKDPSFIEKKEITNVDSLIRNLKGIYKERYNKIKFLSNRFYGIYDNEELYADVIRTYSFHMDAYLYQLKIYNLILAIDTDKYNNFVNIFIKKISETIQGFINVITNKTNITINELFDLIRELDINCPKRIKYGFSGTGCFAIMESKNHKMFSLSGAADYNNFKNTYSKKKTMKDICDKLSKLSFLNGYEYAYLCDDTKRYTVLTSTNKNIKKLLTPIMFGDDLGKLMKGTFEGDYSCCERKILAFYDNKNNPINDNLNFIIKYKPCFKCEPALNAENKHIDVLYLFENSNELYKIQKELLKEYNINNISLNLIHKSYN